MMWAVKLGNMATQQSENWNCLIPPGKLSILSILPKALCLHFAFHLRLHTALTLLGHTIHVKEKSLSFLFSSSVTSRYKQMKTFTNPRAKARWKAESSSLFQRLCFNKKHSVNVSKFPKELCSVERWKEGPYNADSSREFTWDVNKPLAKRESEQPIHSRLLSLGHWRGSDGGCEASGAALTGLVWERGLRFYLGPLHWPYIEPWTWEQCKVWIFIAPLVLMADLGLLLGKELYLGKYLDKLGVEGKTM